jgi:hypothetical protein
VIGKSLPPGINMVPGEKKCDKINEHATKRGEKEN